METMKVDLVRHGNIATLTINNIARRNAISDPIRTALFDHLNELMYDSSCRAIVLTGAGGYFSAGGDVKYMKERAALNPSFIERRLMMWLSDAHQIIRLLAQGPKPVVTAVEGPAFGAGLALALASDVTVASRSARFCAAQILRGLAPDVGLYHFLSERAGPGRARELLLSGREFDAEEALRHGVRGEGELVGRAGQQIFFQVLKRPQLRYYGQRVAPQALPKLGKIELIAPVLHARVGALEAGEGGQERTRDDGKNGRHKGGVNLHSGYRVDR